MKLRKGVYVPWGPVQKMERLGRIWTNLFLIWLAVLTALLLYTWLVGPVFN